MKFKIIAALFLLPFNFLPMSQAAENSESNPSKKWLLGFAGTSTFMFSDSLSAQKQFENSTLQMMLVLPSWEKYFSWSVGGIWKFNISGNENKGLHAGPLLGFGSDMSPMFFFAGATIGAHYNFDSFALISFDGGPTINSYRGGEIVNFQIKPFGTFLGTSVHFYLD